MPPGAAAAAEDEQGLVEYPQGDRTGGIHPRQLRARGRPEGHPQGRQAAVSSAGEAAGDEDGLQEGNGCEEEEEGEGGRDAETHTVR